MFLYKRSMDIDDLHGDGGEALKVNIHLNMKTCTPKTPISVTQVSKKFRRNRASYFPLTT